MDGFIFSCIHVFLQRSFTTLTHKSIRGMCDREKGGPCIFSFPVYRELKEQFVLFAFAITRNERSQTAGEHSWNGRW